MALIRHAVTLVALGCAGAPAGSPHVASTRVAAELAVAESADIGLTIETLNAPNGDSVLVRLPAKVRTRHGLCGFDLVLDPNLPVDNLHAAIGAPDCDLDAVVFTHPPDPDFVAAVIRAANWATDRLVRIVSFVGWDGLSDDRQQLARRHQVELVTLAAQTSLATNSETRVRFRSCCVDDVVGTEIEYAGRRVIIWDANSCLAEMPSTCSLDADVSIVRSHACPFQASLARAVSESQVVVASERCVEHAVTVPTTDSYSLQVRIASDGTLNWLSDSAEFTPPE